MNKKNTVSNFIQILLSILILLLSGLAFYALAVQTDISAHITSLFNINFLLNSVLLVLCGMFVLMLLFGITYIFMPHKSINSLFYWILLFFAFITLPDILQSVDLIKAISVNNAGSFLSIQLDLLNSLSVLSEFPKDILLLILMLFCFVRSEKFFIKKKEIVLLALSLLLCIAMIFLPAIYHLILFAAVYCLIILTHSLFTEFMSQIDKRYEKVISLCILTLLVCKCVYRALLIINSYLL